MSNSRSHPRDVTRARAGVLIIMSAGCRLIRIGADVAFGASAAVMLGVAAGVLADIETVVVTNAVIALDFIAKVAHAVEALAGEWDVEITDDAHGIGVDTDDSTALMTASECAFASPLEEPLLCC